MASTGRFPPPEEVSFMLLEGEEGLAVPVDRLPLEEWESLREEIMLSVGRGMGDYYARGAGR